MIASLETLHHREGILFPAAGGNRIDINNWRTREWTPALKAAGVEHRRIYDMRHTFATWSLAAGMSIFTLARRMGTSVPVIDATYGHLAIDADGNDRDLLDAYDAARGHVVGTNSGDEDETDDPETTKPRRSAVSRRWARRVSNLRPLACEPVHPDYRIIAECREISEAS